VSRSDASEDRKAARQLIVPQRVPQQAHFAL
jgi:hypothetical protein